MAAAVLVVVALCVAVALSLSGQGQEGASSGDPSDPSGQVQSATAGDADGKTSDNATAGDAAANAAGDGEAEAGDAPAADENTGGEGTDGASSATGPSEASGAESPDPAGDSQPVPASDVVSATIAIDATLGGGGYSSFAVTVEKGGSVYDALRATGSAISGSSTYVRSINGLAEFQCGPKSGWLYYVDGTKPDYSCGSYILTGGEYILWKYVDDYTNY